MHQFALRFHHIGLATKRPELTLGFLKGLGYAIEGKTFDPMQNVHLRFCTHPIMPPVELVEPGNGPGPLDSVLAAAEESFYHMCYETERLDTSLDAFKSAGHRVICVSPRKPAVLFDGRHVSFYKIRGFGLIELLEPN